MLKGSSVDEQEVCCTNGQSATAAPPAQALSSNQAILNLLRNHL